MCKRGSMGCHPFGHLAGHGGEKRDAFNGGRWELVEILEEEEK